MSTSAPLALDVLMDALGALATDGSDPARILRRVMTHVVDTLEADAVVVLRQNPDGAHEQLRAMGSLDDATAELILARLPRPLPVGRSLVLDRLVVLPMDIYSLVVLVGEAEAPRAEALCLAELITRHAGQALENARLRDELRESESLKAVGQAVRRVLHDLRNPIGRIHVAVDRAAVPGTDAETVSRMHTIIASAADDVLNIANEVNDFTSSARVTKIRITAESLLAALEDGCASMPVQLRCASEHPGVVHCDPQKLLRALTRLIESTYGGERSSGDAGADGREAARVVDIRVSQDGTDTRITVQDDGPGIPEPLRASLFEPFASSGRSLPRGLGLAIVRSIVRAHGGEVTVAGGPETSAFVICLPGVGEAASRPAGAAHGSAQDSRVL